MFALHSKVVQNLAATVEFVHLIIKSLICCVSAILAKLMTLEITEEHVDHLTEQMNINKEAPAAR